MSFVGKVLIVVQVVLSVCFMAFAGAVFTVQSSWKDKAANLNEELAGINSSLSDTRAELAQFKEDMTAQLKDSQTKADQFEAQNAALQRELDLERKGHETTRTELKAQQALAQIAGEEAQLRRDEAIRQRVENKKLHQSLDRLMTQVRSQEDQLFNKERSQKEMVAKQRSILDELATLKSILSANDLSADPNAYDKLRQPPPEVQGVVLETRKSKQNGIEFVEISIGSDDGLAEGHDLYVYRQNGEGKYLGKIRLVHVTPDTAVGTVITRAKNGVIQRGDNVTTKL